MTALAVPVLLSLVAGEGSCLAGRAVCFVKWGGCCMVVKVANGYIWFADLVMYSHACMRTWVDIA
jgi:hypothetical protein